MTLQYRWGVVAVLALIAVATPVFDGDARLIGSSPVLLGGTPGDDSVPGIGTRPIAQVLPQERTTPAGRFVAERGRNAPRRAAQQSTYFQR